MVERSELLRYFAGDAGNGHDDRFLEARMLQSALKYTRPYLEQQNWNALYCCYAHWKFG